MVICLRARLVSTCVLLPIIAAVALPLPSLAAAGSSWVDAPSAFVVVRDEAPNAVRTFAALLEAAGGHLAVAYSSSAAVIFADDQALADKSVQAHLALVRRGRIDPVALAVYGSETKRAATAWNAALDLPEAGDALPEGFIPFPDAGPRPARSTDKSEPDRVTRSTNLPFGAQYYDTSEFLAGSCAVGVWLLEAAGSTYDWTTAEETQTLGGVQSGLANWVRKGGAPAGLSFYLDIHTAVPVSGVPIEHPMSDQTLWINEVMDNLGWTGADAFEKCFAYNNSIRDALNTNWCYSMFIVDSNPAVNQGLFQGGGYAWGYYGGPWLYMSRYSTWAYNYPRYYAVVPMHESGHIFMDTDEYDGIQQWQGYLNESDNLSTAVVCIQNQNDSTRVCPETRRQLGWRDGDSDGILDILDSEPAVTIDPSLPDPTSNPRPVWTGSASVTTIPNLNPASRYTPHHNMTIARIVAVECRADAGAWSAAVASDGAFDGYTEAYSWTSPTLLDGVHIVEARARTSAGNWSTIYPSDTITLSGAPNAIAESEDAVPQLAVHSTGSNPAFGPTLIEYRLPAAGSVDLEIYAGSGVKVRTLLAGDSATRSGRVSWDGMDDRGRRAPAGVYLCRVGWAGRSATTKLVIAR